MGNYFSYETKTLEKPSEEPSEETIHNHYMLIREVKQRKVILNRVEPPKPLFESIIIPKPYVAKKINKKKKKKKN